MSNTFVVLMGLGIVFIGLICIIFVCMLMSALVRRFEKKPAQTQQAVAQNAVANAPASAPVNTAIPNRGELAAAIAAAISEYSGKDISGIRILSIKKL